MGTVFVSFDADNAGRLIGHARMEDDPGKLARISQSIDRGNQIFTAWANENGGSMISCGGDEGVLEVPATALSELQAIKAKYESALNLTVSIGVGVKMSEAFKALLASKLRGKNRVTMYDKDVQEEIKAAEVPEKQKIVEEYLTKAELTKAAPIHHTGDVQIRGTYHTQPEGDPEIQQQQIVQTMPEVFEVPDLKTMEEEFRQLATDSENRDRAKTVRKTGELAKIKAQVSAALQAVHKQLPVLQQIKQASPPTYEAVLSVVQGLIALGKEVSQSEQTLQKHVASPRRMWSGGGTRIPALGTPERKQWDQNYLQAVANYFTNGQVHKLRRVTVPVDKLDQAHMVAGNDAKTRLYHRMVRAGDKMPPMVVHPKKGGRYHITDGNHRYDVARANNLTHVDALIPVMKSQVNITHNPNLPPAGMTATSTGGLENYDLGMDKSDLMPGGAADHLTPQDFDQEQLAIGTQHELEHTEDYQLAQEIAMDHLAEDPDYYKDFSEGEKEGSEHLVGKGDGGQEHLFDKGEPLEKMALMHDDPDNPITVYRVQNERGEGPYISRSGWSNLLFRDKLDRLPMDKAPGPYTDFPSGDIRATIGHPSVRDETRFGFHSPEAAQAWFGRPILKDLESAGYKLTPVKAKKAWISNSKRQVIFIPHESETALNMAKSDWDWNEKEGSEHLVGKGDGGQEHLFDKGQPLEKMALIHDDPGNPITVYRVQNKYGVGPYVANKRDFDDPNMANEILALPGSRAPAPKFDFSEHEWNENDEAPFLMFGFHSPEAAHKWFGSDLLDRLDDNGFRLTPVKASKVYRSKSGKQVAFIPHESEKAPGLSKSDWDWNEKEELDPADTPPDDKVLDKSEKPDTVHLWRAADDDDVSSGTSFADDPDTAREYLDNPGFGGGTLYHTQVSVHPHEVVDLTRTSTPQLARMVGRNDPGAIGVDEWIPRDVHLQEHLRGQGYKWAKVRESFPAGATTWMWLGGIEDEDPELEEWNEDLDKSGLPAEVKSIRQHRELVPGEALDSRHVVVQGADGKNKVREVAAGMHRDMNSEAGNPTGPGMGQPLSTRRKPSST